MDITIKDIAKLANVSPSTVSRVISDHSSISEKTKERVRALMDAHGYHPNYQAQSLGSKATNTIGIIMPDATDLAFQNPFFLEIIRGISSIAQHMSYDFLIVTGTNGKKTIDGVKRMVQGKRIDGFILLYSKENDPVTHYLIKKKFPFVIVGKPYKDVDNISHVDNDNKKAAKEMVDYFIEKGHRKIAYIGGEINQIVTMDRLAGYKQALHEADIPIIDEYIIYEKSLQEGGHQAGMELIELKNKPTALLVSDDVIALGILTTLAKNNIKVPDDISIISFNNVMIAELANPALSSVDIQVFKLGYYAGECLIEKINEPDEPHKRIIIPFKLIERESSV